MRVTRPSVRSENPWTPEFGGTRLTVPNFTEQQRTETLPEPSGPPLILPVDPVVPIAGTLVDIYLPDRDGPAPSVLLVHGLYPEQPEVTPRYSRFYRDYASHLARRGVAAAVVDHDLTRGFLYHEALATVTAAIEELRAHPAVDAGALGLWFFSGGGPLSYPFLASPPPWLRCVELTYPVLPGPGTAGWPDPQDAVAGIESVPTYLTLVEHEIPDFVEGQQNFVSLAQNVLSKVHVVADASHGFDATQDAPHTREAVDAGLNWIAGELVRPPVA